MPKIIASSQQPLGVHGSGFLNPEDFGRTLGLVTWLMTMSPDHHHLPIKNIETRIFPALVLKQFRLIRKKDMPAVFLSWATVSEQIKTQLQEPTFVPMLQDWRSGRHLVIIDCISPFAPVTEIKDKFIKDMIKSVHASSEG